MATQIHGPNGESIDRDQTLLDEIDAQSMLADDTTGRRMAPHLYQFDPAAIERRRTVSRVFIHLAMACRLLKDWPAFLVSFILIMGIVLEGYQQPAMSVFFKGVLILAMFIEFNVTGWRDAKMRALEQRAPLGLFTVGPFFSTRYALWIFFFNIVQTLASLIQLVVYWDKLSVFGMLWWFYLMAQSIMGWTLETLRLGELQDEDTCITLLHHWLELRDIRPTDTQDTYQVLLFQQRIYAFVLFLARKDTDAQHSPGTKFVLAFSRGNAIKHLLEEAQRLGDERSYRKIIHMYHLWHEQARAEDKE